MGVHIAMGLVIGVLCAALGVPMICSAFAAMIASLTFSGMQRLLG